MSALRGDNVVERGEGMPWYDGPTLLEHLETVEIAGDRDLDHRRFPVQWVIRPISDEHHDFRGYAGQVAGGVWQAGDDVIVLPSGRRTSVASVETADAPLDLAVPGMSVTIRLADDLDVSRGDMLADPEQPPTVARELEATVCWMAEKPLEPRTKLAIKHTTRTVRAVVDELVSVVDIHTLEDQSRPDAPGAERHRPRPAAAERAARGRRLCRQPHHRSVHPDRRGDERHRRRRHDPLRAALAASGESTLAQAEFTRPALRTEHRDLVRAPPPRASRRPARLSSRRSDTSRASPGATPRLPSTRPGVRASRR